MSLLQGNQEEANGWRLAISAHLSDGTSELEFIAASEGENLEDRFVYLTELAKTPDEGEFSFRLLSHYASSIQRRKYYGIDIVTVRVEGSA